MKPLTLSAFSTVLILGLVATSIASPREKLLLDHGWRFHLGEVAGYVSHPGGVAITKWSWREVRNNEVISEPPQNDGLPWKVAKAGDDVFGGQVGYCWFQTVLPKIAGPKRTVYFESVDDNCHVFLNGKHLVAHDGWNDPFAVNLDSAWHEGGQNVLTVLVWNSAGRGGINNADVYTAGKEGLATGAAGTRYDDSTWRKVDVPHDFVVESPFDQNGDGSHGFRAKNVGWYRRTFDVPATDKGKKLRIDFDGVYRDSTAWLNGHWLGHHASGYTSFEYDVTPYVKLGGKNVLVVRADATNNEGWWYEGGGIYRHVWLTKLAPVHFERYATVVTSEVPNVGNGVRATANVTIRSHVLNEAAGKAACDVRLKITDGTGQKALINIPGLKLRPGVGGAITANAVLSKATLWSIENPHLYQLVATIEQGGTVVDQETVNFGIRTIRFDKDKGFFLNGKPVKIQGTCNHQDFAGVGVALPDKLHTYKIEKLKEMGANAYRCSHHPPAPELLDACDRLGMLVMDENRKLGDSEEIQGQVVSMVMRDRNHPSIVLWSLCNEEWAYQHTAQGRKFGEELTKLIHTMDTTRPITAAMNGGYGGEGLSNALEIQGFNYNIEQYDRYHRAHPDQPCIASESASILTTRGIYLNDATRGYVTSMTDGAENTWRPVGEREYMAGAFIWTGFDYRGEPTPYSWPCVNSHFGVMDTCGFPKDDYWYYQSWWGSKPVVHLAPHWNWAYSWDETLDVRCYSNCDKVELFVNGVSQGTKEMTRLSHLVWKVKWASGAISAKGYKDGKVVATTVVETTGDPAKLQLQADRPKYSADGEDVAVVRVNVLDAKGRVVPFAANDVSFEVVGPAKVIGVGNGDPGSHEPDKASRRRAFNGHCMVLIQTTGKAGTVKLIAHSPFLPDAVLKLEFGAAAPRAAVK